MIPRYQFLIVDKGRLVLQKEITSKNYPWRLLLFGLIFMAGIVGLVYWGAAMA
jgi:hypothetical protein